MSDAIDILSSLESQRAMYSKLLLESKRVSKVVQGDQFESAAAEQIRLTKAAIANLDVALAIAREQKKS